MNTIGTRFRQFYGSHPLHLLVVLFSFALAIYTVGVVGPAALWNSAAWWQSILVWFLGAVIAHDLLLFPLYALADRTLTAGSAAVNSRRKTSPPHISPLNYVRIPALATAVLLLLFFPGIIEQGSETFVEATGFTQEPYLRRFLVLTAVIFAVSALAYAVRLALHDHRRPAQAGPEPVVRAGDRPSDAGPRG
ncbi:hypothetical protein QMK17_19700 [Rhodococcus sp. G-MC3]|uniref:hypothetical protein n=1 Tax=Rhodococcus sp. G-MC3 TaxID=3046209 RepID=UPI0024BA2D03|nr:hypothetical protein [Rhodococcus sp. G-MC3]MDJ0395549.1 hypothetical protein [Rhodococcus sp. G-MC3]